MIDDGSAIGCKVPTTLPHYFAIQTKFHFILKPNRLFVLLKILLETCIRCFSVSLFLKGRATDIAFNAT